ncbi:MAG: helix-turn-helix transcriptional regulator [Candidatus Thiodiazotropha endolucinida]
MANKPNRSTDTFGGKLMALRLSQELSQANLASSANISTPYYSAIENDSRLPPPKPTLMRIIDGLRCSSSDSNALLEIAAFERGRSRQDAYLPEEAQALISDIRTHADVLPPRFIRALQTHIHEAVGKEKLVIRQTNSGE